MKINELNKVVLYDGTCGFCHFVIRFIFKHEGKTNDVIRFASLQSDTAQVLLSYYQLKGDYDTVVYIEDHKIYIKSKAALMIARHLKWPWSWLAGFEVLPLSLRDLIYDTIAKNRKKIAGSASNCELPEEAMKVRLIG